MKFKIKLPSQRFISQIGFWLCLSAIVFALYLQFYNALSPCPLCIGQRLMVGLLGLIFLFGWLHLYRGVARILHGFCTMIFALLGAAMAGRQVWLEHLPPNQAPPCGPSLTYMLEHLPFQDTLRAIFQGTAECADVSWRMLGYSIPTWTLMLFGVFTLFGLWQILRKDEK